MLSISSSAVLMSSVMAVSSSEAQCPSHSRDSSARAYPCRLTPARLVTLVCVAQVCAQIGAYTWPALLPGFIQSWHITNGEAGWITGLFYAAYTVSVPILVTLTDRIDPRAVYLTGVGLTIASHIGFAVFADGVWSAGAARAGWNRLGRHLHDGAQAPGRSSGP